MQTRLNEAMEKNLAQRLRDARQLLGLTQVQLSKASGIKQSDISKIERGETLRPTGLIALARVLNVSPHWLADGEGQMHANETPNVTLSGLSMANMARGLVPLISSVRAGTWGEINDHMPDTQETFPVREAKTGPHAFALRVEGDSMTSDNGLTFPEGTVLIVDPERAAKAGDYVVAKDVDTQRATFKRLTTDGARWYLKPLNRDYRPIEIDDPAMRVIGVVVEYWMGGKL